jgi:hypothetical protein
MNTLTTTPAAPRCDVLDCPGYDEPLVRCANPAHDDATGGASPFFHPTRAGAAPCHGRRRRGRPRRLCSRQCANWVDNFYVLGPRGRYERADTSYLVGTREFTTYRAALREVRRLIASGQVPAGSPVISAFLTPIKSVRTVQVDDIESFADEWPS